METLDQHETELDGSMVPEGEEVPEGHPHHHGGHHDHVRCAKLSHSVQHFVASNLPY